MVVNDQIHTWMENNNSDIAPTDLLLNEGSVTANDFKSMVI